MVQIAWWVLVLIILGAAAVGFFAFALCAMAADALPTDGEL